MIRPVDLRSSDDSGLIACAFARPNLRWRLSAQCDDVVQLAYELERSSDQLFGAGTITTGRVEANSPLGAAWPGADLASREETWLRVRVWTNHGASPWSEPLRLEGGLYHQCDWIARPISPLANAGQVDPCAVPMLRKVFIVDAPVSRARLYVSALGIAECRINGVPVSPDLFEPGWTAYGARLLYAVYDVTDLLMPGENVLSGTVGDGWWRGHLTWLNLRAVYGDTTALLAQLELTGPDGARQTIATDGSWRGGTGELVRADFYNGCDVDLNRAQPGWRGTGFDDAPWQPVAVLPLPANLVQRSAPPVREVEHFDAVFADGTGTVAVDCGQNLTGYLRLHVVAAQPAVITVRHAEVLEPDGSLHTAALRGARATDSYTLPAGRFTLAPSFTYHGFRHAEIGLGAGIRLERVEVCVVSSDLPEIGHFQCSDPSINQLVSNIRWSQRGNFLAIPTDCPQRDERLGWTGDIQVFAPTACTNFDSRAFLGSWLVDLASEQAADGQVPSTVPNVIQGHPYEYGGIGWADAATLVPWALYEAYGDSGVLACQFSSMCAWVDWGASRLGDADTWEGDFHLGDWLDPGAPPDKPEEATTPRDYIASAYLAFSAATVSSAARVLCDAARADHYAALAARVAKGTWARWHDVAMTTQAGCALAVMFDIAPADTVAAVGAELATLVQANDGRIGTGFLGTPLVLPALTRTGQHDAAFRLLLNDNAPGWLYQVRSGATTMWERWDALQPDGSLHSGAMAVDDADSMTSFNHYAYGSVGAWLYRTLAGIGPDADQPGYRHIVFAPQPGGGIDRAEARIATPLGLAAIEWRLADGALQVVLDIPPAALGRFHVPAGWRHAGDPAEWPLGSGRHKFVLEPAG